MDSLVHEFLNCDVEEIVYTSGGNHRIHFLEESCLNRFGEYSDANISATKLLSRYFLAHLQDAVTVNDHLHGFIAPLRINNHGDWSGGPYCNIKDVGIKYDISIKNHEA